MLLLAGATALVMACGASGSSTPTGEPGGPEADAAATGLPDAVAAPPDEAGALASWAANAPLPFPQQETAVVELGGLVYVIGGLDARGATLSVVHVYDPKTNQWSAGDPLPKPLHHVNATAIDGRIWITGALTAASFAAVGESWVYEPASHAWTPKAAMPSGSERGASMAAAIGPRIFVAGGLRGGAAVADMASYDTAGDTWTTLAPLPVARDHGAGAAIDGVFFAVGGRGAALGGHTARVDAFDPTSGLWSERAPLPTSRAGFAAAVVDGRIFVAGGEGNPRTADGVFAEVEAYDPRTNAWTRLPSMRTPRHGMGGAALGRSFFVPGGGTAQGVAATDVVETLSF